LAGGFDPLTRPPSFDLRGNDDHSIEPQDRARHFRGKGIGRAISEAFSFVTKPVTTEGIEAA
jgi:hypothetical protein